MTTRELKSVQLDKDKVLQALDAIYEGLEKYKIEKIYAGAAMSIALEELRLAGLDIHSVKTLQFSEHN